MAYHVARASERRWIDSKVTPGLREAVLADGAVGAQHLEIRLCELEAGATIAPHRHPFEESWFVFSGQGRVALAGLEYDIGPGNYGVAPVGMAHQMSAIAEPLTWIQVWAPKPPNFTNARDSIVAELGHGENLGRPSETDPRHRFVGHFQEEDVAPFAQLSMPGYHGPNIKNIAIRMMVDRLLGAQHHTLFLATIAPRSGPGHAAREHYHPFEEIYYFLSGGMRGTLDGDDVLVGSGDLVWVSVDATHGFVNENNEAARWLEVQSPVPPDSDAFFFPDDWIGLPGESGASVAQE
jgi:quercetin dioxygenase-like cupin family protein